MRALVRAVITLLACAVLATVWSSTAHAAAPPLVGAAAHPLWAEATVEESDRELDLLQQAGATTIRVDMGWSTLEADGRGTRAAWYLDKVDTFFAHARARGLKVIVTFLGSPCWASTAPDNVKQGCTGRWWERGVDRYPPRNAADYADAAAFVAQRWGGDIAALEVWNEPNVKDYYFETPDPVGDYAALVKATYPRVKAVSSVPVIAGAMLANDEAFLGRLYAAGIGPYTDGISIHPYTIDRDPASLVASPYGSEFQLIDGIPRVRASMIANGDGAKKLWITELGWSSCEPGPSEWCLNRETQAKFVGNALREVRDRWDYVEALTIYTLRNTGYDQEGREDQMGLLHRDFSPKPAWPAFADALADLRADPRWPVPARSAHSAAAAPPRAAQVQAASRRDRTAPVVRGLAVRPGAVRQGSRMRISWRASERARVSITIERRNGRRWVRQRGSLGVRAQRGRGGLAFAGRLGSRLLSTGRYRVVVVARDAAGNRSKPARAAFRVLPAGSARAAAH